jgi:hypothetical protein
MLPPRSHLALRPNEGVSDCGCRGGVCVFRLCIESGGPPDWCDVLYRAERSPVTQGMVRAVLYDVDANIMMSQETFEERMRSLDGCAGSAGKTDWKAEGF